MNIPGWAKKEINNIVFEFLWNGKQNKVKANVVIQDIDHGGYKMCDINVMSKVQQLKWVKRYFDNSQASWKSTFESLMKNIDIRCFLMSSFHKKEIPITSDFYKEMLETLLEYRSIPDSSFDISHEIIWYNRYITSRGHTIYCKRLKELGIMRIHHLFDMDGNLLTFDKLPNYIKNQTNFLTWNGLIKAIPKLWIEKLKVKCDRSPDVSIVPLRVNLSENDVVVLNFKLLYAALVKLKCDKSQAVQNYSDYYGIDDNMWKQLYILPHKLQVDNRMKEFQYKITHGYLATNLLLYKMKIIDSPRCNFCNLYRQSISHMLFSCLPVRSIWYQLEKKILNVTNRVISINEKDVLFGIAFGEDKEFYQMINSVLSYTKYYVYKCKLNNEDIVYTQLLAYIVTRGKLNGW